MLAVVSDKPTSFPRPKPARTTKVLSSWIGTYAHQQSLPPDRVRRMVGFECVIAAFEDVHAIPDGPVFILKGGVAMELRTGARSRATKDIDAVIRGRDLTIDDVTDTVTGTLRSASLMDGDITFSVNEGRQIAGVDAVRFVVQVRWRGESFHRLQLEVSTAQPEDHAWDEVPMMGIAENFAMQVRAATVRCLPIPEQMAQKIHACTAPTSFNDRFRDLIDLMILAELTTHSDADILECCARVFAARATHPWPPTVRVLPDWPEQYTALADGMGYPVTDVGDAARVVQAFIDRICGGSPPA